MRLIDADALFRKVKAECNPYGNPTIGFDDGNRVLYWIEQAPTVESLNGQEPVEPILALNDGEHELWQCGNCKVAVFQRGESYCHNCGKAVKWDAAD